MLKIDWRHYQLLLAIRETGTLTAAAAHNGITQSAASHQIREAERRLGIQLVEKNGRLLILTQAGEKLAEAADIVGPLLGNAEARAQEYSHGRQRRLRIAYGPQDGLAWAPDMAQYLRDLPAPHLLDLIYISSGATAHSLTHNQADLALALGQPRAGKSAFAQSLVCDDPLVAIVPPDQPQAHCSYLDAESFEDTVYFAHSLTPQSGFELEAFFGPAGTRPGHVAQIQSLGAIIDLVAAGLGVSIQLASTVRAAAKRGEIAIVSLAPPEMTHPWYLLARPEFLENAPELELDDMARVLRTPLTLG
jgi:LysR family transcriptional regulator, regulator for metE and metH